MSDDVHSQQFLGTMKGGRKLEQPAAKRGYVGTTSSRIGADAFTLRQARQHFREVQGARRARGLAPCR